jgi:hypothetical protein
MFSPTGVIATEETIMEMVKLEQKELKELELQLDRIGIDQQTEPKELGQQQDQTEQKEQGQRLDQTEPKELGRPQDLTDQRQDKTEIVLQIEFLKEEGLKDLIDQQLDLQHVQTDQQLDLLHVRIDQIEIDLLLHVQIDHLEINMEQDLTIDLIDTLNVLTIDTITHLYQEELYTKEDTHQILTTEL